MKTNASELAEFLAGTLTTDSSICWSSISSNRATVAKANLKKSIPSGMRGGFDD